MWRTILGANDAIAIDPGTKDAGPLQGPIPASRDSNQVELDEVLLPFHDGAQSGLQTMLNQLGPALSNHFDLGNDLNLFRGIANAADVGGGALRGEIQDADLRNLVKNSAQAATPSRWEPTPPRPGNSCHQRPRRFRIWVRTART